MRRNSLKARQELRWVATMLAQFSLVRFGPNDVREVRFDGLDDSATRVLELRAEAPAIGARGVAPSGSGGQHVYQAREHGKNHPPEACGAAGYLVA